MKSNHVWLLVAISSLVALPDYADNQTFGNM